MVPAGSFRMGCVSGQNCGDYEYPVHKVTIGAPFAVGVYEVTFAEWDTCVRAGGCGRYQPEDGGWGRGKRPVINVNWKHAQSYVAWLSRESGARYRLLSEAEWEYVARAGSGTRKYSWGNEVGRNRANCNGCGSRWDGKQTAPVGSFGANGFGLHDVHGNVWEWVEDCWHGNYEGAPAGGTAWMRGDCSTRVVRGGSWDDAPGDPPVRGPRRVLRRGPARRRRLPCCPEYNPLNPYLLTFRGFQGGQSPPWFGIAAAGRRGEGRNHVEESKGNCILEDPTRSSFPQKQESRGWIPASAGTPPRHPGASPRPRRKPGSRGKVSSGFRLSPE